MKCVISFPIRWPGLPTKVIVVVVIFLVAYTLAPVAVVPLGLGVLLGGWLAPAPVAVSA